MAGTFESLVDAARSEWDAWGRPTWNLATGDKVEGASDNNPDWARYIKDNYCIPRGDSPTLAEISDDEYYWSAVGMSYLFERAGFTSDQFPFSNRHSTWIRKFISARRNGDEALYYGYRLNTAGITPEVGDLVGYARGGLSFEAAQQMFDYTTDYESHSDLVVERREQEIDVIGFNVMDSVAMKTIRLDENGYIADRSFNWFFTLRRRF
jgi:hypothetical protein